MKRKKQVHKFLSLALVVPFLAVGMFCCCSSSAEASPNMSVQKEKHACCDKKGSEQETPKTKPCDHTQCQKDIYILEPDTVFLSNTLYQHITFDLPNIAPIQNDFLVRTPVTLLDTRQDMLVSAKYPPLYIDHQQFLL